MIGNRDMTPARLAAKALFKAGGWLSWIKTPHRFYAVEFTEDGEMESEFSRWAWCSCESAIRLLGLSARLDWEHWDHWALVHDECDPVPCSSCGGCICADKAAA